MTDDRKHPANDDLPTPHDREQPVARPELDEGELYVYTEADCADIAAEVFAWVRELPSMTEGQAEEVSTMVYELLTGAWADHVNDGDGYETD